jgi:hypothetical protein
MRTGPDHDTVPLARRGCKNRICLRCGNPFRSLGPQNRRCDRCRIFIEFHLNANFEQDFLYAFSIEETAETIRSKRELASLSAKNRKNKPT